MLKYLMKPLCLSKARKVVDACQPYLKGNILDVGAGRCLVAKEIVSRTGFPISCIDVKNLNETELNLKVYDGKKIPFRSGSFYTVLLVYVLHHCEKPEDVLNECIRVSKKRIIIFEDFGPVKMMHALDYFSNKVLHGVETPLNFKSEAKWLSLFKSMGLKPVHIARDVEKQWFYPFVKHRMFVLDKQTK